MFFSNTHWPQLAAPFYSLLFFSYNEVREHLTRDQRPFLNPASLQILQIHSSMLVVLLFSSPHSSSTGFRSEDGNGQQKLFFVVFEVCVWIIVQLEDPNMAHYKISNRVSHFLIFYLLVFDRIHDAMCLNNEHPGPPAEI